MCLESGYFVIGSSVSRTNISFSWFALCGCVLGRFSPVLFAALWTVARQAPLHVGSSRQEHWGGWPRPPPGDLPDPGIEPAPLHWRRVLYQCHLGSPLVF